MNLSDPDQLTDAILSVASPQSQQAYSPEGLNRAVHYCLSNPGKKLRPNLCVAAAMAVDTSTDDSVLYSAITALELIHTYSLVHDDLPAMDDDDMRRGKATLHKAYDEATAILVGDGLQARAFEVLADTAGLEPDRKIRMIKVLAHASGMSGMVGGQYVDTQAVNSELTIEELRSMHQMKTGALIRASLAFGGIAANANSEQLKALDDYGLHIGLAFQVVDDILDVEGSSAALGKTVGKDAEANKPTYVKLLGLDGAKAEAKSLLQSALNAIQSFGEPGDKLRELAHYIVERDR